MRSPTPRSCSGPTRTRAVLVVFQAMDAAGKDSTIKHVMSGVNPQGVDVISFRHPTAEELDHPFLWRTWKAVPAKGRIGIFNRSHYEEVVALRVHPEWLAAQHLPDGRTDDVALGRPVRRHQRVRAAPRSHWRDDRQVLPQRLEGGAEATLPPSSRPAAQGVEVQRRRHRRAPALGRLHGGLRAGDQRHVDPVGAVVRDPGRPQARDAGDGRRRARRHARVARSDVADGLVRRARRQRPRPATS